MATLEALAKAQAGMSEALTLAKAQVQGYTRKDGTVVKPHTTSRPAAAAKTTTMSHSTAMASFPRHRQKIAGLKNEGDKLTLSAGGQKHTLEHKGGKLHATMHAPGKAKPKAAAASHDAPGEKVGGSDWRVGHQVQVNDASDPSHGTHGQVVGQGDGPTAVKIKTRDGKHLNVPHHSNLKPASGHSWPDLDDGKQSKAGK